MITNETIIKAANAAGLDIRMAGWGDAFRKDSDGDYSILFAPRTEDTDNAMIRRGADISIAYHLDSVSASFYMDEHGMHSESHSTKEGKAQARREAVILCAASKWTAIQGDANEKL